MQTWRRITTWDAQPGFNMALDEALLLTPRPAPTLRLYSWSPPTLSLGYFQRWAEVPAAEQAEAVVRRLTGGGAIHHSRELTFSISAPDSHPLYRGPIADSYRLVHTAIAAALALRGVGATLRGVTPLRSDRPHTGMCFHESTELDLVWDGAKGVGSAQRRKSGRVLHHGSIKLGTSPLEGEIASLEPHTPDLQPADLAPDLLAAFAEHFDCRFEVGVPDEAERAHAFERAPFFRSRDWLRRR